MIPPVGHPSRNDQESEAYSRATELIHQNDGRLGDALHDLKGELEGKIWERDFPHQAREYAQALCDHVEQCWATAILR